MKSFKFASVVFLVLCLPFANADENLHHVSMGGGIANPSILAYSNPAGYYYSSRYRLDLGLSTGSFSGSSTLGASAIALLGDGRSFGAGIGAATSGFSGYSGIYGIGYRFKGINTALGVGGAFGITGSASVNSNIRFGAIYNPEKSFRVGLTVTRDYSNFFDIGLGFATNIGDKSAFALDVTTSSQPSFFSQLSFAPGIQFAVSNLRFSFSIRGSYDSSGNPTFSFPASWGGTIFAKLSGKSDLMFSFSEDSTSGYIGTSGYRLAVRMAI